MADISSLLNTIKKAIYGRDMREALHDSIKAVNDDLDNYVKKTEVDAIPTADSTNPVASKGVKTALNKLLGVPTDNFNNMDDPEADPNIWAIYNANNEEHSEIWKHCMQLEFRNGIYTENLGEDEYGRPKTAIAVGISSNNALDFDKDGLLIVKLVAENGLNMDGNGIKLNAATITTAGAMSADDKSKLDALRSNDELDSDITERLVKKVDKESGKGLSTIDNISVMHSTYIGADGTEKDNPYATMTINGQNGKSNVEKILTLAHRETFDHPDGSVTEEKLASNLKEKLNNKQDKLTFDDEPTANSTNPVTSGGVKSALDGKADKYTEDGGFVAGSNANLVDSGAAIGKSSLSGSGGGAVGEYAQAIIGGGAVGNNSAADGGFGGGQNAKTSNGAAVGQNAESGDGFAGGKNAKTIEDLGEGATAFIDAIQLGTGTNENPFSMQIYDYQLLSDDAETKSATDGGKYLKDVGKLSSLATSVKDNIVNAVNSLVAAHNDLKLKSVPHKDVSGYPVTFADHLADEEFIKCNVCGCKNLIPYPYADTTKTENGVTFTVNSDGSITVNGTATQNTIFNLKYHLTLPKGKFYFSGCPKNGSTSTYYIAVDVYKNKTWQKTYSNTGDGVSVNTENLDYDELTLSIIIVGNYTANNLVFKPQFESGTAATSFEVNKKIGTLDSTDGKYKIPVTLTGKNVLPYPYKDPSKTGNGISFTVNGDGSISLTGTATGKATYYFARNLRLKSGTYTLSEKMKNQSSNVSIILDTYAGGTFLNSYSASAKKTTVITLSQDVTISIYAYVPTGVVCENYPVKPQLEIGTAETEYEPYTENSVTAELGTALSEGEYIDIINKKRYGADGSATDITVSGSLKTIDSANNYISCDTATAPSKIELSYYQDINKVLSEITNAVLSHGGDV